MKPSLYIIDFLNVFSDYREIKYKQVSINFHTVKHQTKAEDIEQFFDIFFTTYLDVLQVDKNGKFLFIMKRLNGFEDVLKTVMVKYRYINMKFMIIEDKYTDNTKDKNKDDFLCQYTFQLYNKENNCVLMTNDKYRDRQSYAMTFSSAMSIRLLQWQNQRPSIKKMSLGVNESICANMLRQQYRRCMIPKRQLAPFMRNF